MTEQQKVRLRNFDFLAEMMAEGINDKFIKIQELCSSLDPKKEYDYRMYLLNGETSMFTTRPYIEEDNKWYVEFLYEDTCCSNELPCKDYKDSIIGMTVEEIKRIYSADKVVIFDTSSDGWEKVIEQEL